MGKCNKYIIVLPGHPKKNNFTFLLQLDEIVGGGVLHNIYVRKVFYGQLK
jgi:hypothetical protein